MRTSNLTDALLDYWTARAEGVPADELELRANGTLCVRNMPVAGMALPMVLVLDYSTNWALTGPLIETRNVTVCAPDFMLSRMWEAFIGAGLSPSSKGETGWDVEGTAEGFGSALLTAVCRAVVRAAFGDEVEDLV